MTSLQFAQKAVVVTHDDKILMVRKSDADPNNPGCWELPGGRLKDSEDVDKQMVREVHEETGYTVEPGDPIDVWSWYMWWRGEHVQVVAVSRYCELASNFREEPRREPDDFLAEQRWFGWSDLKSLDIIPSQLRTIEKVVKRKSVGRMSTA